MRERTPRFVVYRDNALWKARELALYFEAMGKALKEKNPQLFLCPDMTFLQISGWNNGFGLRGRELLRSRVHGRKTDIHVRNKIGGTV